MTDERETNGGRAVTGTLLNRMLIAGFLTGGVFAAALALWQGISSAGSEVLPPPSRWIAAAVFGVLWLYTAVRAWVALFEAPEQRRTLTGALVLSQLGKYVPGGGIVQVTGMVAMSRNEQVSTTRLALGLPVVGLSAVAAGGVALAGLSVADTTLPNWARALCLLGLLAPLLLWRPVMATTVRTVRRVVHRIPSPDDLPSQRAIVISGAWTTLSLLATGIGYALLAQPLTGGTDIATLTLSFMVAWTVGFLILPVPGGIGIREVVLIGLIGGSVGSIVGASIAHRIINIVIELSAVGLHLLLVRVPREAGTPSEL